MTLAMVFKGADGIVLAADSRVTLEVQMSVPGQPAIVTQSYFDNATKLLKVQDQDHVAAVTYGLGTLGSANPRTAHSYIPEFEARLSAKKCMRLTVEDFAKELSDFFVAQHAAAQMPSGAPDMFFIIGGYDEGAPYGRMLEFAVPSAP